MHSRQGTRPVVAVLLALGVVVAGCGGGAKANGIEKLSASAALAKVKAAVAKVDTVRATGHIEAGGQRIDLDLHDKAGAGTGTMTVAGGRIDLVRTGDTIYVRGDAPALQALGATSAQASLVAGKWLKQSVSSGGSFASIGQLLDTKALFDSVTSPQGTITTGETTTVDGHKVFTLIDSEASGGNGTLYVATTGDPLPVRVQQPGAQGGVLDFGYGGSVDVKAPSGAVDLSSLTGG